MKILFLSTVMFGASGIFAQTPYDNFAPEQSVKSMIELPEAQFKVDNEGHYILFDNSTQTLNLMDNNDNVLKTLVFSLKDKKFLTMDPHAENYYETSPYAFCANNPVLYIDPDGRDYWSTNDPELIRQFLNSVGSGSTQHDFTDWNHATDAEFVDNLTYNDETGKFYTSYGTVENGVATVVGVSFNANITPVSYTGEGYPGAFVYQPRTGFLGAIESLDKILNPLTSEHLRYNGWAVNSSGRITGVASPLPIMGYPPLVGRGGKMSTKGMPHGDGGRALTQAEKQIAELQKQMQGATKAEQKIINKKIQNIREIAQQKAKGETHWRK